VSRRVDRLPDSGFPYLDEILQAPRSVIAMAHRGGAGHPDLLGIENTMEAFSHAVDMGFQYLETDTHASVDGTLFAFHDDTLDRVTDSTGRISELTADEVKRVTVSEKSRIPTLAELLETFPETRINIDLKSDNAVRPLAELLTRLKARDRVCVGSFSHRRLSRFRHLVDNRVATSASPIEVAAFMAMSNLNLRSLINRRGFQALQVPLRQGAIPVITPSFVEKAHEFGVHVHVWTVDDRDEIEHLLALGVDGFITDRTDVLKNVLTNKGLWKGST
jgi:glycerophosphoryl diester phosphodiesterase